MPCCIILSTVSALRVLYFLAHSCLCVWYHMSDCTVLCQNQLASSPSASLAASSLPISPCLLENTPLCSLDEVELNFEALPHRSPRNTYIILTTLNLSLQCPAISSTPCKSPWQSDVSPMTHQIAPWIPRAACQSAYESWKWKRKEEWKKEESCISGVWANATWSTKPLFHCKSGIKNSFNTQGYTVVWQWWELYCTLMGPACADR